MIGRRRQPAGVPTGGQFAAAVRPEPALNLPTVALDAAAVHDLHQAKLDQAVHLLAREWESNPAAAHDRGYLTADADIALRVAMPQITTDTTDLALEFVRMRAAQPGFTAPTGALTDEQVAALAEYALNQALTTHARRGPGRRLPRAGDGQPVRPGRR